MPQLEQGLLKVVAPLAIIAIVVAVVRIRRLSWRDDLRLTRPPVLHLLLWVAAYVAWMLLSDRLLDWRGPWDFSTWARSPVAVSVSRVLAVCFLGPVAEELLFRGVLYYRLVRTRLRVVGAIVVTAAVWAVIHTAYAAGVIGILFVDGLLLGLARYRTQSLLVPIAMHITWNLYAIW